MIDKFSILADAVKKRFDTLSKGELYTVDNDRDVIWATYLNAFPEGSNPIFRKRSEHDCACCRHFIRGVGNIVAIQNGERTTIWDLDGLPEPYATVASAMDRYVRQLPIRGPFRTKERSFGNRRSVEVINSQTIRWDHFYTEISSKFISTEPDAVRGPIVTKMQVFQRALEEIDIGSVEIVRGLIEDNNLYRGEEFLPAVKEFGRLKRAYDELPLNQRENFVWENADSFVVHFRTTVIGGLVNDLSSGTDLEIAVRKFEAQVAPSNFKRSKSLITSQMVEDAMKTIKKLDLEPALERRYARIEDVSVNNVLFVDNSVKGKMKDGIEGLLMEEAVKQTPNLDHAIPITMDEFLKTVVPQTTSMEIFVENDMLGNFMSLTAPIHPNPKELFQWPNNFGWSYDGNVTDTIKQRVKKAGGNVNAILRVSLAWGNTDDLDIHVVEPNRNHIYFGNKDRKLDVDMNAPGTRHVRNPVENVSWSQRLQDGIYVVSVNQYAQRESIDVGFTVEVETEGQLHTFQYKKMVVGTVKVIDITVKNGKVVGIKPKAGIEASSASQHKWGVETQKLVRVNTMMLSPNHWDDKQVGNRHWFFMLENCRNPEPTRGIYNEFLNSELNKHRKVFEVLGDKTKCQPTHDQLSGLGFSSTRKDKAKIIARGKTQRVYEVTF